MEHVRGLQFFNFKNKNIVINESIEIKQDYFGLSHKIIAALEKQSLLNKKKAVIGICGESGSGKSVTAKCLKLTLEKSGIFSLILHMDCYFKLPPKNNHEKRKEDIAWVGVGEVKMDLWQSHINAFKSNAENLTLPVVDYEKNLFFDYQQNLEQVSVLIVEGGYAFYLEELDYKIFLEKNYKDTLEARRSRTREVYDPFVEQVLAIEHNLVSSCQHKADMSITKDYLIQSQTD